ncbi:helix-hairpin-helix domain-containing protein [Deinococcus sp. HMF7604]|uniref:helix-hairpin-helix domain-containing protein n=1 Tax=Deinococcus betulae TaxID=2873312 RepID=UPI001CCB04CA|nr:helix-hairpin-helix domain-containing protein [Deinococcus betulae]MBZ9753003.1 helix-hairpin-helix domain-containing protein [Deinococcus betulae]
MTQTAIPDALRRVRVTEDATLDQAAQITVDPTGGGDYADLVLNPDLAGPEARHGYEVRAAIAAALEPLRRYNRGIRRRYGTYDVEQTAFEAAMEKASTELEQLVHLTPVQPTLPELVTPEPTRATLETQLADDFPEVEALRAGGYRSLEAVRDATDEALRALPGIGVKRLEAIRDAAKPAG